MLSSDILFDIHIASLWYLALEMLSSEILFDIHIASLWYQALGVRRPCCRVKFYLISI